METNLLMLIKESGTLAVGRCVRRIGYNPNTGAYCVEVFSPDLTRVSYKTEIDYENLRVLGAGDGLLALALGDIP